MTLEEYARQQAQAQSQRPPDEPQRPTGAEQETAAPGNGPEPTGATQSPPEATEGKKAGAEQYTKLIGLATKICKHYKFSRQATDGIMKQVLLDIAAHKDPVKLILFLSEALDRASGGGDLYIKQVEQALNDNGYITESQAEAPSSPPEPTEQQEPTTDTTTEPEAPESPQEQQRVILFTASQTQ